MIRKAVNADLEQITNIFMQLHKLHCEIRGDYYKMTKSNFFYNEIEGALAKENASVIVYEEDNIIKGYALMSFVQNENEFHHSRKTCFVEHFAVKEEFRRAGIGSLLIDGIKELSSNNCCDAIELGVWAENYDAVDFYATKGFTQRTMRMEYILN